MGQGVAATPSQWEWPRVTPVGHSFAPFFFFLKKKVFLFIF
jgi:hypothetical protein